MLDKPEREPDKLYCHPNHYEQLKLALGETETYVYRPFGFDIVLDDSLPGYKYEVVDPDFHNDDYTTWFEDLNNPPEWAIKLGCVKESKWAYMIARGAQMTSYKIERDILHNNEYYQGYNNLTKGTII